jgi:penicillin-binding protein 2
LISAIAALEEGIVDEKTEFNCKGSFRMGRRPFHCWKKNGHGKVDVVKSLRESCDVFYYKVAAQMDIDVLSKYARLFGLGSKTGINLPRETSGLIPTKEWKLKRDKQVWQKGETLSCIIGQSFMLTTPLQLAMTYATFANGGTLFRPKLIKEVFSNSGTVVNKTRPEIVAEVKLSKKTIELVKRGLYEVVNTRKGTAWWYKGSGIRMAGKTGTSQVISFSKDDIYAKCENREYKYRHHGVFASYAPAHDPRIAVAVVVEHGCHGGSAAGPVAKSVMTTYMKKYFPEEQKKLALEDRVIYRNIMQEETRKRKIIEQRRKKIAEEKEGSTI